MTKYKMELIPRKKLILSIVKKLKTVDNILPLFKTLAFEII